MIQHLAMRVIILTWFHHYIVYPGCLSLSTRVLIIMLSTPSAKNVNPIGMISIAHVIANMAFSPYHKAQFLFHHFLLNCFIGKANLVIRSTRIRNPSRVLDIKVKYLLIPVTCKRIVKPGSES